MFLHASTSRTVHDDPIASFLMSNHYTNCRTAASIGHHVIWLKFFLMNGFFSLITDKGNMQTRFCRQSDQLSITVALTPLSCDSLYTDYNRPNLKVFKVLAIDRMLTWEKNESLTVSSFCRSYRNTVTDITQSKKCMQNFSVHSGAVRTRVGSPRSNHETTKFAY